MTLERVVLTRREVKLLEAARQLSAEDVDRLIETARMWMEAEMAALEKQLASTAHPAKRSFSSRS